MTAIFVFAIDERAEPGLHVAVYSLLKNWRLDPEPPNIRVYFDGPTERLQQQINATATRALATARVEVLTATQLDRVASLPSA